MLISVIFNVLLGGYVFFQNRKSILNLTLASFALSISGWIFSIWSLLNINISLLMGELPFIFAYFFLAFLAIFVYELSPKSKHGRIVFAVMLSLATVMTILTLLSQVITSVKVEGNFIVNTFGPAYTSAVLLMVFYIIFILATLVYKYRASYGLDRLRLKYVLLGIAIFLIISVMTNLLLPTYFNIWSLNTVGPASSTFMIGTIAYAIFRYHLLDIWVIIRLGVIFTVLFTIIAFIYVFLAGLLSQYIGGTISLLLVSLLVTFTFEPLKKFIENKTDKIFFRKRYRMGEVIGELTSIVHKLELNTNKIIFAFNGVIKKYFKVEKTAVAIMTPQNFEGSVSDGIIERIVLRPENPIIQFISANPDFLFNRQELEKGLRNGDIGLSVKKKELAPSVFEAMENMGFVLAIPFSENGNLIGICFVGEKKSGDWFTSEDIQLLKHLTGEIGIFLNNAYLYEDLKKLDEAKSSFLSVVSHQLRTPLSAMRWSTELLLDGSISKAKEREFLNDTYKNSIFMIYHLDDMLTALDIEDKEIKLRKESCDLSGLLREVLDDNRQLMKFKNLNIDSQLDSLEKITCDCKKIKKIFEVLISNSINYTRPNGRIIIKGERKFINGIPRLEISVSDDGIGVTKEEEGYLFQKFYRGDEAKKMSPNGFGLGLFIVKFFIKAHGGEVYFESAGRNRGIKFYFSILCD